MKPRSDGSIYEELGRNNNTELYAQVDKWLDKLYSEQEELGGEFAQEIDDNFWELVLK